MAECEGDCDDADPTVYLGAPELCDGIDNDCDGSPGPDEVDADGDGFMICAGDCDDTDPDIYPGNGKDTYITYNGDFVVQADDYSADPPKGGVNLSALLTDSDSQNIEGWEVQFDIYDIEDILVASVSAFTDSLGIAHNVTSYNIPLFGASSLYRASIPSWNKSLFGMVPYGYNSGYNSLGMPLYNNTASYYMPLSGMSSLGLPFYSGMSPLTFYGMSTFNMLNVPIYNTLNPGLWGNNNGLGGLWDY